MGVATPLLTALGLAAGLALGASAEWPRAAAQETQADGSSSKSGGDVRTSPPDPGPVWQVVSAESSTGVAQGKYILYNVRSGESYALHNNGDRWMALPFVEGDAGAVGDSSRGNLKRFGRRGPTFLPFSAVLEDMKGEAAERQRRKDAAHKPAPER